jgi:hypothetical protein
MKTHFPNPDDILNFTLSIEPDEGMYKGGKFMFDFKINQNFPHDPPKVKCTQKIYHPNIDLEGNVCLNILREDWKPVLNLNAVIVGLQVRRMARPMEKLDMLTALAVSVPRAECFRSVEQGGCRRFESKPRRLQAECARGARGRGGERAELRPRAIF